MVLSSSSPNHADAKIRSVGSNEASRLIGLVRAFHGESGHAVGAEQAEAIGQLCANSTLGQGWVLTIEDRDIGYGLVYFRHSIDHGVSRISSGGSCSSSSISAESLGVVGIGL
jgi:hypothetical protein